MVSPTQYAGQKYLCSRSLYRYYDEVIFERVAAELYVVLDRRLREQVEGALRLEAFEAGASYDVIEHVASFFVHFNSYLGIEGFGEYPLEERRGIDEAEGPGGEDKPVHERRGVADPGIDRGEADPLTGQDNVAEGIDDDGIFEYLVTGGTSAPSYTILS